MMGSYQYGPVYSRMNGYMSGNLDYLSLFHIVVAILIVLDLALLAVWLWKQITKK